MATLCKDWEDSAKKAQTRVVCLRTGIALEPHHGFQNLLRWAYKLYIGGHIGTGNQALPWIHIQDLCRIIDFALETQTINGPINAVAPTKTSLKTYCKGVAKSLNRPNYMHIPGVLIKLIMGELGESLLNTPYVEPGVLENHNFKFSHKNPV
tara:strand:+ start:397 stop:852 length:456 start_codon:yes stop_codon:yes gene_type:complete